MGPDGNDRRGRLVSGGQIVNIGLRIDYLFIYESYLKGATRNGHVINTGLTLYFNMGGK